MPHKTRAAYNAYRQRWRRARIARGLCERCEKPHEPGRTQCAEHLVEAKVRTALVEIRRSDERAMGARLL